MEYLISLDHNKINLELGGNQMLDIVQDFIVVFIEINTLLIIWSNFQLREKTNIKINIFIAFIGSIITDIASTIKVPYIVILTYVSIIFLVRYFYKLPLIKTILQFVIISLLLIITQLISIVIITYSGVNYVDDFLFNFYTTLIGGLLAILASYCILKIKSTKLFELSSKIVYCFIINLGTYVIITKLIWEYSKSLILNNLVVYSVISIAIFLLNVSLYWYIAKISEEKKALEIQRHYEPILEDMIEEIRRKQHDFKNYLNAINGIVEVARGEELKTRLKNYIENVNHSYQNLEDIVYIKDLIIRAVVYNKLCEAERLNIRFLYNINNNFLGDILKDYEISDILGNLINNAFEAVSNDENKEVLLNIFTEENSTVIEVKNNGTPIKAEDINNIFKRGFSTKGENRGYGLYNIKKIVERSGGKLQLSIENNYTTFRILFKQTFGSFRFSTKKKAG